MTEISTSTRSAVLELVVEPSVAGNVQQKKRMDKVFGLGNKNIEGLQKGYLYNKRAYS